jgi:hypothetical protein
MAAPETGLLDGRLLPGRIPDDHVESLATAEENLGETRPGSERPWGWG